MTGTSNYYFHSFKTISLLIFRLTFRIGPSLFKYRILPNKGAGRVSKVASDIMGIKLSNGGFGLKIGQLLRKLRVFWTFMKELASSKLWGTPLLGRATLIGRIRYIEILYEKIYNSLFY